MDPFCDPQIVSKVFTASERRMGSMLHPTGSFSSPSTNKLFITGYGHDMAAAIKATTGDDTIALDWRPNDTTVSIPLQAHTSMWR